MSVSRINFLIPGAGKSGTSSIAHYLKAHPQVFMPHIKEPTFFTFADDKLPAYKDGDKFLCSTVHDLADYRKLFDNAGDCKAVGEASTYYFLLPERTIANIKRLIPDHEKIKIIIILRNPVDRAFSQYTMFRMNGFEDLSFEDAIKTENISKRISEGYGPSYNYLEEGLYSYRIKAYQENFNDVKVYLYEDLCQDPNSLMADIFSFLDVDPMSCAQSYRKRVNPSGLPKIRFIHDFFSKKGGAFKSLWKVIIPKETRKGIKEKIISFNLKKVSMCPSTRSLLIDHYKNEIEELEGIIGRDLSNWLKK
ncbi:MAG: sulfotransferase [Nitrospiraceae bacterium]|nr:sulfotransferase [Nitrospiraceae bacterium]